MHERSNGGAADEPGPSPLGIDSGMLPKHVAIIMDGNGRWAAARKERVMFGHEAGVAALRRTVRCCGEWGIGCLTVYAFSQENWSRSQEEVSFIFGLAERYLREEAATFAERGVRLRFLGQRETLPPTLRTLMAQSEARTAGNAALDLVIALNYGARQDLAAAARAIAAKVAAGQLRADAVDEACVAAHLSTAQLPPGARDPDLVIRTSGEQRLSNFLLYEAAYSELYFSPCLWPDFGEPELRAALEAYAARERRFGTRTAAKAGAQPVAAKQGSDGVQQLANGVRSVALVDGNGAAAGAAHRQEGAAAAAATIAVAAIEKAVLANGNGAAAVQGGGMAAAQALLVNGVPKAGAPGAGVSVARAL